MSYKERLAEVMANADTMTVQQFQIAMQSVQVLFENEAKERRLARLKTLTVSELIDQLPHDVLLAMMYAIGDKVAGDELGEDLLKAIYDETEMRDAWDD